MPLRACRAFTGKRLSERLSCRSILTAPLPATPTKLAPLLTSFTKAAKQLRLSTARVSEMVRNLEERLGVRLVERTTRSVASTGCGSAVAGMPDRIKVEPVTGSCQPRPCHGRLMPKRPHLIVVGFRGRDRAWMSP